MLGTHRFFAFLVLTATVSITLSSSEEGNIFSRLFNQGKGYFSSSPGASSSRAYTVQQPQQQQQKSKPKTASSRSWNITSAASSPSTEAAVSQARGYQSQGGGGGWGWPSSGDDYVYSHSTHGKGQGVDINTLIGGLSLAGLLGVALYAFSRPTTTTVVMMNATGRRRRSADDFEDDMMDGESLPEFLSRIGKYLEKSWVGEEETKQVEPFKLY